MSIIIVTCRLHLFPSLALITLLYFKPLQLFNSDKLIQYLSFFSSCDLSDENCATFKRTHGGLFSPRDPTVRSRHQCDVSLKTKLIRLRHWPGGCVTSSTAAPLIGNNLYENGALISETWSSVPAPDWLP